MYTTTQFLIETHQANLYLISSSPWSLLPGPLQFHSLSLPSSSFQPAPPWTGSLFSSNWILPSPSFLAAAPSDLSLPLTPPTTYRLTGYPAGFSGEIPFFFKKIQGIKRWAALLSMQIVVLPFHVIFSEMHFVCVLFPPYKLERAKRWGVAKWSIDNNKKMFALQRMFSRTMFL